MDSFSDFKWVQDSLTRRNQQSRVHYSDGGDISKRQGPNDFLIVRRTECKTGNKWQFGENVTLVYFTFFQVLCHILVRVFLQPPQHGGQPVRQDVYKHSSSKFGHKVCSIRWGNDGISTLRYNCTTHLHTDRGNNITWTKCSFHHECERSCH